MKSKVIQGNNIDTLKQYPDNHFDSIVTDPPYGIEFLAKEWDSNTGAVETWAECLRVLKPGGYLLAFSAARTYHNLATNIEGVGFEIRDQIMWLYASGFPKAQDIGKAIQKRQGVEQTIETVCTSPEAQQWSGWKTALKPAHEPIVMARKPFKGSAIDNVLTHGVGALNIDATRIATDELINCNAGSSTTHQGINSENNVGGPGTGNKINSGQPKWQQAEQGRFPSNVIGEVTDYQKFFYCPKVNRAERHIGFEDQGVATNKDSMLEEMGGHWVEPEGGDSNMCVIPHIGKIYVHGLREEYIKWCKANNQPTQNMGNNHPTVKPVELMKYLVKLVTPPGGKVLDPFCGSGSTGMAAVELDYDFTGCELDPAYVNIATQRITAWHNKTKPFEWNGIQDQEE